MKLKQLFIVIAAMVWMVGCEKPIELISVTVNPAHLVFEKIDETATLTATLAPLGATADVNWTSSDTETVSVAGDGLTAVIIATGYGEAKITATAGEFTSESTIIVKDANEPMFDLPEITIAELRDMYEGTPMALIGTHKIIGVVSSDIEGGNSTSLKNIVVTTEDNSTGMAIRFSDANNDYEMGDQLEIKLDGTLTEYGQAMQIEMKKEGNVSKMGTKTIEPIVTTVENLIDNYDDLEFCVVKVKGIITPEEGEETFGNGSFHQSNTLTSGEHSVVAFVSRYADFIYEDVPREEVYVTGILQRFNATIQLIIRNINDVSAVE